MQKKVGQGTITVPVPDHNEIRTGTLLSIMGTPFIFSHLKSL
jgi:hypothetical protein